MFKSSETLKTRKKQEEEKKKTEEQVKLRGKQGQDTSKGEQVWYSRRVDDGCLLHWAIITHGQKYELRLPNGNVTTEKVPESQKTSSFEPARVYEARVVLWSLKEEMNKLRALKLATVASGDHTRDYTVCQIGWTTMNKDKVDAEWAAARSSIVAEDLGYDDCRELLKTFGGIIKKPEGCALDYDWYTTSLETPSHRLTEITADKAVKRFQNSMQNGLWGVAAAGAGAGIVYGAYEAGRSMDPIRNGTNAGSVPVKSATPTLLVEHLVRIPSAVLGE
ncbi:hypothetical protein CORC01_06291 [Colletotrichum orchidophilum]|uniref:Uncharacterized protein n=1 Tax=Colletotrichum orchidophilum TaxID=1209926 RepID=A0A1G4BAS5_9PEZI|nr:uncharacterized protein CORC01_06291 [Colletotrichum orchidophilum]OHE98500.1 hypothetical protein CORC01_06291 [Colletotrichum orchidophilum]